MVAAVLVVEDVFAADAGVGDSGEEAAMAVVSCGGCAGAPFDFDLGGVRGMDGDGDRKGKVPLRRRASLRCISYYRRQNRYLCLGEGVGRSPRYCLLGFGILRKRFVWRGHCRRSLLCLKECVSLAFSIRLGGMYVLLILT